MNDLPKGDSVPINLGRIMLAYLARALLQIWKTDNGLLFPLVRREFHSPSVVKPVGITLFPVLDVMGITCNFHISSIHFVNDFVC